MSASSTINPSNTAGSNPTGPSRTESNGGDPHQPEDSSTEPRRPRRRWLLWGAIGLIAVVALGYGAIFIYTNVINDAPDALDEGDLASALDDPAAAPAPATGAPEPGATVSDLDGLWAPTAESEFGYRVEEVLAGVNTTAVGRSNEIDGSLTIDGITAEIDATVQVASITSDDSRRDGQFRGRIMDADSFPTATFSTTQPIEFGEIPSDGEQISAPVTGELTLKGVTQPVSFEVTAQRNGSRIGVLGSIPVLFSDYGIENPSFGPVSTEDDGLVEFVLVFEQS